MGTVNLLFAKRPVFIKKSQNLEHTKKKLQV